MKTINEVEILKLQIKQQTKQIYELYKRIEELNDKVHNRRDSKQQENI